MRLVDLNNHEKFYGKVACHVCGERPDAVWSGHEMLYICQRCAIDTLPKLIADTVYPKVGNIDLIRTRLKEIRAVFWEAITSNALYDIRHKGTVPNRLDTDPKKTLFDHPKPEKKGADET